MRLVALALGLTLLTAGPGAAADARLDRLIAQVKGDGQFYDAAGGELGWFASFSTRNFVEWFRVHAARLLAREAGANAAPAVDALIDVLRNGPNDLDTGDGIIPLRSEVARALGAIGDPRAIGPLAERLKPPVEPAALTAGASVAPAARRPHAASLGACAEALATFGARAAPALPALEAARTAIEDEPTRQVLGEAIDRIRSGSKETPAR